MHGLYQEMVESVPDETTGNPSVPNLETLNNRRTSGPVDDTEPKYIQLLQSK